MIEMITINNTQSIPILMYHSISSFAYPQFRACIVSPTLFADQMAYLARCCYNTITVSQFAHALACGGEGLPPQPIVLTFDDAYADFYTHALPVLQKYGFVATLYVPTNFVGSTSLWLKPVGESKRAILSWSLLAEISNCGIECGAHTHTHPYLNMLPPSVARDEIVRSKELLENYLRRPITSFAYPYGYYNTRVRAIVRAAGFTSACAIRLTTSSLDDDPFALARVAITADTKISELATLLNTGAGPLVASKFVQARGRIGQYVRGTAGLMRWNINEALAQREPSFS